MSPFMCSLPDSDRSKVERLNYWTASHGVLQDSIPCPVLFNLINNLDAGLKGILINWPMTLNWEELEGREALRRDLDKLEMGNHQPNEA